MFVLDGYNSIAFPVVMLTACVQLHVTHTQINTHVHTPNVDYISHNCFLMVLAGAYHIVLDKRAMYSKPLIKNV